MPASPAGTSPTRGPPCRRSGCPAHPAERAAGPVGWSPSGDRPARRAGRRSRSAWPTRRPASASPTLLVDADVYGGVVAQLLGLLDESPGLAGAARLAATGALDGAALARLSWTVRPQLRVLTGLARADRWPELRPRAVDGGPRGGAAAAELSVVDCSFCLEEDEELSFDTAAPRRNGATLAVLEAADTVLCVSGADPVALQRTIRALGELRDVLPEVEPVARGQPGAPGTGRRPTRGGRSPPRCERFAGREVARLPARRPSGHRRRAGRGTHARRGGAGLRAAGRRCGRWPPASPACPSRRRAGRGAGSPARRWAERVVP